MTGDREIAMAVGQSQEGQGAGEEEGAGEGDGGGAREEGRGGGEASRRGGLLGLLEEEPAGGGNRTSTVSCAPCRRVRLDLQARPTSSRPASARAPSGEWVPEASARSRARLRSRRSAPVRDGQELWMHVCGVQVENECCTRHLYSYLDASTAFDAVTLYKTNAKYSRYCRTLRGAR